MSQQFYMTRQDLLSFIHFDAPRPLHTFPNGLAFSLTPYSFLGHNWINLLSIWAKGIAFYLLVRRLTRDSLIAFLSATLFIIYPADTGFMSLRLMAHNISIFFYLLAANFLLTLYERFRLFLALAMFSLLSISLLIYEALYPVVFFTPLLLIWKETRLSYKVLRLWIFWSIVPTILFLHYLWAILQPGSAQSSLVEASNNLNETVFHLVRAYNRNLLFSWTEAVKNTLNTTNYILLGAVIGAVNGVIVYSLSTHRTTRPRNFKSVILFIIVVITAVWILVIPAPIGNSPWRVLLFIPAVLMYFRWNSPQHDPENLLALGLVLLCLGFVMFLPASVRSQNWRVFLFTAPGAALFTATFIYLTASHLTGSYLRISLALCSGVIIGTAFVNALNQHRGLFEHSQLQQLILGEVTQTVPDIAPDSMILLFDETGVASSDVFVNSARAEIGLQVLYDDSTIRFFVCTKTRNLSALFYETCEFKEDDVIIAYSNLPNSVSPNRLETFSYSSIVAVKLASNWQLTLLDQQSLESETGIHADTYDAYQLICRDCNLPVRRQSLLPAIR